MFFFFFVFLSILISSFYFFLIFKYLKGWDSLVVYDKEPNNFPMVSVVVACRNEEEVIQTLLNNLTSQDYPKNKFEIVIVDDFSSDRTMDILRTNNGKIKVFSSPDPGKKSSIAYGIENTNGEWILTTDADCKMESTWIRSHVALYLKKQPLLQLGLVDFEEGNFLQKILNFEFFSLIGSAAGAIAIGKPVLANAANMAFTKDIYLELKENINTETPSGDDVFLLQEIKKKYPGKIIFNKSKDCLVTTKPPKNFKEFINQRIRWASKNKYYSDRDIIETGLVVFSTNLILFVNMALCFWDFHYIFLLAFLFLVKSIIDFQLLNKISKYLDKKNFMKFFALVHLFYPIYVVFIGLASFFVKYQWKGRKY